MVKISEIHGREILDSRGNPTVEVDLVIDTGEMVRASVPSGASTGKREAIELRDGDKKRYAGKGVLNAVNFVNTEISKLVIGQDPLELEKIDKMMIDLDGTENKGRLGANAILGVSLAVLKAGAAASNVPIYQYIKEKYRPNTPYVMPVPMFNILNGGLHAEGSSDFQEYKIAAIGAPSLKEAVRWSAEVFHVLKKLLHDRGMTTTVGDEGGFAPAMKSNDDYPQIIVEAIEKAGYKPGQDIYLALDPASSAFYDDGKYTLKRDGRVLNSDEMIAFWVDWVNKYPIISIEDGLGEDDWENWKKLYTTLGKKIQIMGDDLLVTNPKIIKKAIKDKLANSALIKINQIGSMSETIEAVNLAHAAKWSAVVSHRSGETEDTTIADLVVGLGTGMIKTGSASRSERVAKYNQLMRIEEELGASVTYPGMSAFDNIKNVG